MKSVSYTKVMKVLLPLARRSPREEDRGILVTHSRASEGGLNGAFSMTASDNVTLLSVEMTPPISQRQAPYPVTEGFYPVAWVEDLLATPTKHPRGAHPPSPRFAKWEAYWPSEPRTAESSLLIAPTTVEPIWVALGQLARLADELEWACAFYVGGKREMLCLEGTLRLRKQAQLRVRAMMMPCVAREDHEHV